MINWIWNTSYVWLQKIKIM